MYRFCLAAGSGGESLKAFPRNVLILLVGPSTGRGRIDIGRDCDHDVDSAGHLHRILVQGEIDADVASLLGGEETEDDLEGHAGRAGAGDGLAAVLHDVD